MRLFLIIAVALGAYAQASAQSPGPPSPEISPADQALTTQADSLAEDTSRFFQDGQLDLSSFLEHPRGFLPIPIVITEPAVGYGLGGAGMFIRPREEAGEEGWARPDISAVGGFATENGTRGAFAGDASRWMDGRLRTQFGGGGGRINLDFYGLGSDRASFEQKVRYTLAFTTAIAQANWQLAPTSPWSLGLRYVYADVEPKLRDDPEFPGLVDRARVKVSAPTAVAEFDTRDNIFTPTRGAYAESSLLASRESLGANVDFERFEQILMGWYPLSRELTLGARGNYAWSSVGTPFFLRPFVILRGVPSMRYQGDQMASVEAELRWQFYRRWSIVGFGGYGATRSTSRNVFPASQSVGSGGLGFRYELASKFNLHAGIDVAHSDGTTAIYLQMGNAWFRP